MRLTLPSIGILCNPGISKAGQRRADSRAAGQAAWDRPGLNACINCASIMASKPWMVATTF